MTFLERLSSGPPLVCDGGTGTERKRLGCDAASMHRAFAAAGAELLVADSILAAGLEAGAPGRGAATLTSAVAVARSSRGAGRSRATFVAASLGPAGPSVRDDAHRAAIYRALAGSARDASADVLFAETLLTRADADAALAAAREAGLPIAVTFAFDQSGRGYAGLSVEDVADWVRAARPDAAGFNCGDGPEPALEAAERLVARLDGVPLVLRPAAGESDPEAFAAFGSRGAALGARILGGCCGATASHVRSLADVLAAMASCP